MNKIHAALAATLLIATPAFAQNPPETSPPQATTPAPAAPAEKIEEMKPATPPADMRSDAAAGNLTLSDDQAKTWLNKVVYSSDDKNLGEIAAFEREPNGKVKAMHADIGGFLGLGETRVRILPSDFSLSGDRVVLNMTADQAKALPKVAN